MFEWFEAYEEWFALLGAFSLVTFLASLILVPLVILSLPNDYFTREPKSVKRLRVGSVILHIGKNLAGTLFIALGLLMLVLPGQGILALLLGFSMVDFPAKRRIQVRILKMKRVQRAVNWIRIKGKRSPLKIPH